jgi:GNAT superfamily N-acetyltransferase
MDTKTTERTIRRAMPDEAQFLTDLTHRSKAHWGYDETFMTWFHEALTIKAEQIRDNPAYVLEVGGRICGYYLLQHPDGDRIVLDSLFIEPDAIGGGMGTALWNHAMETAASLGYHIVAFVSDDHAEGFYLKQGARRIGEHPSPSPGQPDRVLPIMEIELTRRIQED